jgi:hypothetical protein
MKDDIETGRGFTCGVPNQGTCTNQVSLPLRPFSESMASTRRVLGWTGVLSPWTSAVVRRSPRRHITDALRGGRV